MPVGGRMDAGAQGFRKGFLGGKALGEISGGLAVALEAPQLRLAQDSLRETLAKALERLLNTLDLDQVRADAVDHRAASVIRRFISRTASRMPTNTARDTIACPMCSSRTPGMRATGPTLK